MRGGTRRLRELVVSSVSPHRQFATLICHRAFATVNPAVTLGAIALLSYHKRCQLAVCSLDHPIDQVVHGQSMFWGGLFGDQQFVMNYHTR